MRTSRSPTCVSSSPTGMYTEHIAWEDTLTKQPSSKDCAKPEAVPILACSNQGSKSNLADMCTERILALASTPPGRLKSQWCQVPISAWPGNKSLSLQASRRPSLPQPKLSWLPQHRALSCQQQGERGCLHAQILEAPLIAIPFCVLSWSGDTLPSGLHHAQRV